MWMVSVPGVLDKAHQVSVLVVSMSKHFDGVNHSSNLGLDVLCVVFYFKIGHSSQNVSIKVGL